MFNFLAPIFVTATICLTIYKLFELFVRRKERNTFIEKLSEIPVQNLSGFSGRLPLPYGVGVGLLVGYFIADVNVYTNDVVLARAKHRTYINMVEGSLPIIYGSSVLFFGGLALVVSFLIEQWVVRQKADRNISESTSEE